MSSLIFYTEQEQAIIATDNHLHEKSASPVLRQLEAEWKPEPRSTYKEGFGTGVTSETPAIPEPQNAREWGHRQVSNLGFLIAASRRRS